MDSCGRCPADVSPINSLLLHLSCFSIEYKLRTTPESSTTCYKYRSRAPAAFHTPKEVRWMFTNERTFDDEGEKDSVVLIVAGCVSFAKSILSNPDRQQLSSSCLSLRERDREEALLSSCKMRQ
ncbi:hypothetical protein T4E_8688 [Trichinella pseudospiralis]|uniref:Uncharacterized protein n=1 Tax=Trichinella pseudospiralis TaxID=6337 RepID=A0A0V0XR68_TRIPS|nr:hypothetical protein T4E_8688 [Trichinella pseudospiralis]